MASFSVPSKSRDECDIQQYALCTFFESWVCILPCHTYAEIMTQQPWILRPHHLDDLALGARLLGSGGAGRTYEISLAAKSLLETAGPVLVEPVSSLEKDDELITTGLVGSVIAYSEKPSSSEPFVLAYNALRSVESVSPTFVCTYEMAGVNAFASVLVAAAANVRLVDIDGMGRAFSGLHQTSFNLGGVPMTPCSIVNSSGKRIDIHDHSPEEAEAVLRTFMEASGGWAAFAGYSMNGGTARMTGIRGTMSRALELGQKFSKALKQGQHPRSGIENFCDSDGDVDFIAHGRVIEVDWRSAHDEQHSERRVGSIVVITQDGFSHFRIEAQSEYLLLMENGIVRSNSPEIIDLLDSRTGTPIPAEELVPGFAVSIITIRVAGVWRHASGSRLVGPQVFGYEIPPVED